MTSPLRTLGLNLGVLTAWMWVHADAIGWLATRWVATEGQIHLVLAAGLLGWTLRRVDPVELLDRLSQPLQGSVGAWLWAALPPLMAAVVEWWVPVNALGGIALIASAYGLAGLLADPATWRRWRGAAVLAGAVLPLTEHLDVFLGFPLRVGTAHVVSVLLSQPDLPSSTVLAIDGAFANVDLPCSGVRSLWSGLVVLLGASVAWQRPVSARFVGVAALTLAGLVLANTARVAVLVLLEHQLGWPLVAEVLHLPLGVLGFVLVLAGALSVVARDRSGRRGIHQGGPVVRAPWLLALGWSVAVAWPAPAPLSVDPGPALVMPHDVTPVPHRPAEGAFAARHGGRVVKGEVRREAVHGTVVWVSSRSWLAHHVPTWCLQSGGWQISEEKPARVGNTPVRRAMAERDGRRATALWWFQAADDVTDDHTYRIARGLTDDAPWVLVSVLLDGSVDVHDPVVINLVDDLRAAARTSLETP